MRRLSLVLVMLLLAQFSAPLFSEGSYKEDLSKKLLDYAIQLEKVKSSIENYEKQISSLLTRIQEIQNALDNSQNLITLSGEKIAELEQSLKESKALLLTSQEDLQKEQTLYNQLLMEYTKLQRSLMRYKLATKVLIAVTIGEGVGLAFLSLFSR